MIEQAGPEGKPAARIYRLRGTTYRNLKVYDKAIEDYTKAIELNPNGQYSAALADANASIGLNNQYKKAYELRSKIYRALGQNDRADADSQFALKISNEGKG
jgi:tetratricopeptide (TPR) repeat protein